MTRFPPLRLVLSTLLLLLLPFAVALAQTAEPAAPAPAPAADATPPAPSAESPVPATTPASPALTPQTVPAGPVEPPAPPATQQLVTPVAPTPPVAPPQQQVAQPDPNLPVGMDPKSCPYLTGPFAAGQVDNPGQPWNGTDTGVVVNGHVDLRAPDGSPLRTLLGVDMSRYNHPVDYAALARCGTTFSFVAMDEKYQLHATELNRRNIHPLLYFYFRVPTEMRAPARFARLTDTPESQAQIDRELTAFEALGRQGVQTFVDRMRNLHIDEIPLVIVRNPDGSIRSQARVMAVDIEEKLEPESAANEAAHIYYGRFYAKAVCTWVRGVQQAYPGTLILMYTTPTVWGDYLYAAYPEEAACLNAMPIWVSRTTVDGGDVVRSSRSRIDLYAARLCTASGSNRCVVHQYSHRGLLGQQPPLRQGMARHFDLNRFFLVQPVQTGAGIMFVRER